MATFNWPGFGITAITPTLDQPAQVNRSAYTGVRAVASNPWHGKWSFKVQLATKQGDANFQAIRAFFTGLQGSINNFHLPAVEAPQNANTGVTLSAAAAQGAVSLALTGVTTALVAGNMATIAGQLLSITSVGALSGSAQTINFMPALRAAAVIGASVETAKPYALVALTGSSFSWDIAQWRQYGLTFDVDEDVGGADGASSSGDVWNATFAAGTSGTPAFLIWSAGAAIPVAAVSMGIDYLYDSAAFPLAAEASIWTAAVQIGIGINRTFTVSDGGSGSPCASLFALANANGSVADVTAIIGDAVARVANGVVFGANFIARNGAGVSAKLVGCEIDVEAASGSTLLAGSGALYINGYNVAIPGAAIQINGAGGGTFANGIMMGGIATTGACLALQTSNFADSLINSNPGTFTTAAVRMGSGATRGIKWDSGGGVYFDGANQRWILPASATLAVRNSSDSTSLFTFDNSGNLNLAGGGTLFFSNGLSTTSAAAGINSLPSNPVGFLTIQIGGTNRKIPYYG